MIAFIKKITNLLDSQKQNKKDFKNVMNHKLYDKDAQKEYLGELFNETKYIGKLKKLIHKIRFNPSVSEQRVSNVINMLSGIQTIMENADDIMDHMNSTINIDELKLQAAHLKTLAELYEKNQQHNEKLKEEIFEKNFDQINKLDSFEVFYKDIYTIIDSMCHACSYCVININEMDDKEFKMLYEEDSNNHLLRDKDKENAEENKVAADETEIENKTEQSQEIKEEINTQEDKKELVEKIKEILRFFRLQRANIKNLLKEMKGKHEQQEKEKFAFFIDYFSKMRNILSEVKTFSRNNINTLKNFMAKRFNQYLQTVPTFKQMMIKLAIRTGWGFIKLPKKLNADEIKEIKEKQHEGRGSIEKGQEKSEKNLESIEKEVDNLKNKYDQIQEKLKNGEPSNTLQEEANKLAKEIKNLESSIANTYKEHAVFSNNINNPVVAHPVAAEAQKDLNTLLDKNKVINENFASTTKSLEALNTNTKQMAANLSQDKMNIDPPSKVLNNNLEKSINAKIESNIQDKSLNNRIENNTQDKSLSNRIESVNKEMQKNDTSIREKMNEKANLPEAERAKDVVSYDNNKAQKVENSIKRTESKISDVLSDTANIKKQNITDRNDSVKSKRLSTTFNPDNTPSHPIDRSPGKGH